MHYFESYLRVVIGLDEDDIQLKVKQHNSNFVTYEIPPGVYSIKDISEVVYTIGDHKGTLRIEYVDNSMKTKQMLSPFEMLRFNEKSFFNTSSGFTPFWDYRPTKTIHLDSPGLYTSEKISNLCTINKIRLKCDVNDGSVVNGLRQPLFFCSVSDEPMGYKVFCHPETVHFKKK